MLNRKILSLLVATGLSLSLNIPAFAQSTSEHDPQKLDEVQQREEENQTKNNQTPVQQIVDEKQQEIQPSPADPTKSQKLQEEEQEKAEKYGESSMTK